MKYDYRKLTYLSETKGEVEAYSDSAIPRLLSKPLKISAIGTPARKSGGRSALVTIGNKLYKLKGCNPQPGFFSLSDLLKDIDPEVDLQHWTKKPKGAMEKESANAELKAQEDYANKLKEFKLPAPLIPVLRYDYEMKDRHCAVSICNGDFRYLDFLIKVKAFEKVLPDYKNQFHLMYQWFGFAQYLTKETFGRFGDESNNHENYIIYKIGKGYGFGRVDYPKRSKEEVIMAPSNYAEFTQYVVDFLTEMKYSQRSISRILEDFDVDPTTLRKVVTYQQEHYVVHMPESKIPDQNKIKTHFQKGLDGEMPKPISTKFIEMTIPKSV